MSYNYNLPQEAIHSLEQAYRNKDIQGIVDSKDFIEEAKLVLEQTKINDEYDKDMLTETAKLLKLSLIKSIQEHGFPNFINLETEVYGLQKFRNNIYVVNEKIIYSDGDIYETRIFLSVNNDIWKVVLVEE